MVQRFNAHPTAKAPDPGGLEPHALRRALDYIHSSERTRGQVPLTLTMLAEIAGVSRFHFARRFRRSTGQGLVEYVRCLGLDGAKRRSSPAGPPGGLAKWQVRRVTSYMLDHLDRDVSRDELANLVDLSPAHFCTIFRHSVGRTPREWLIDKRIERARELLATRTLSITEIALSLGYTPSAFGAIFRERVGMTPSAFRRAL